MRKPPTMTDVARRAGVSPATVSNVLGNRKPVEPGLVERVRKAASELDYHVDRAASRLRSGKTNVIAVAVPSLENPFFASLIASIEIEAQKDGYEIIVSSTNELESAERSRVSALLSWRPAGLIVVPTSDRFPGRQLLDHSGIPYVLVDRVLPKQPTDTVSVHNVQAAEEVAEHLLDFGHREILIAASALDLFNIRERSEGVRGTYERAGQPLPQSLEVGRDFETATDSLRQWLGIHGRPSAIFALTNVATLGVVAALSRLSIRVPNEVSLVGFDDYAWMRATTPSITAVRQPLNEMSKVAWQRLRSRIRGEDLPPREFRLHCNLDIRQSTMIAGPSLLHRRTGETSGMSMAPRSKRHHSKPA
jgi:LacI family transcriptional regulator